jgi:hypothetical protein
LKRCTSATVRVAKVKRRFTRFPPVFADDVSAFVGFFSSLFPFPSLPSFAAFSLLCLSRSFFLALFPVDRLQSRRVSGIMTASSENAETRPL